MVPVSALVTLYTAVYGKPPSSHSTAALLAMEQILGLAAEDPLSRMMIVLLHSCDRMDGVVERIETALRQRSQDETITIGDTSALIKEIKNLLPDLSDTKFLLSRRRSGLNTGGSSTPVAVDTYRKSSPMLSYLGKAFHRRNSVDDHNRTVGAARYDLSMISAIGGMILLIGIGIGIGIGAKV